MPNLDVSLVLPCFNEAETFSDSVKKIINVLDNSGFSWEIIFVDDASRDSTKKLIQNILRKYPKKRIQAIYHQKNLGRGQTVMDGINQAQGRIVGFIDIDLEVSQEYLPSFFKALEKGYDSAIAWRIYDFTIAGFFRWFSSKGYTLIRKIILGLPYKDTEAGYKFFNRSKILAVIKKCHNKGWFWDTEIMAGIYKAHLKTIEIPVVFIRRQDKTSTVRLIPDSFKYLKDLINFRLNYE